MIKWCLPLALALATACGGDGDSGSAFESESRTQDVQGRRRVESHMIHYGPLDEPTRRIAERHDLVTIHPGKDVTAEQVADIRDGVDPLDPSDDVIVLGYISVGEDLRTGRLTDEQMRLDPRFVGDGTGPRVDPRGPQPDGAPLTNVDPLGAPSPGGLGFAPWYLDDNSVDRLGQGDGRPDRNAHFGACFVNAGHPAWFDALQEMTQASDGVAGFREILSRDHGRGLGCDGVFLDTIDTCAPNHFTGASSSNPSEFEWTAPGFSAFLRRLRAAWPDRFILQNRGLFFFDRRHPHFAQTTRGSVDFVLFESYRLNSNTYEQWNASHYPDNRYRVMPKLLAEAGRPDGFQALSLGYAEGPGIAKATLTGGSTEGLETLLEDIQVSHDAGFRHYISDAALRLANSFVLDRTPPIDTQPPVWSSVLDGNAPRIGLQRAEAIDGALLVSWDVALDMYPVRYALYASEDPALTGASRIVLSPAMGRGYEEGTGYPHEAVVTLPRGRTWHLRLRAFDSTGNEEENDVTLTVQP